MAAKTDERPLVQQATEWLAGSPRESLSRWELLGCAILLAYMVWWIARSWGWAEGTADAARRQAQARRDELDYWRERQRREFREDVRTAVAQAMNATGRDG